MKLGSSGLGDNPRNMYARHTKPRSPKALNDIGSRSKAILLSSASLANVRHEMEEAQGQCFAGKRRVGIPQHSSVIKDYMNRSLRYHM